MAGESIKYTSAEAFQAYVRTYAMELFTKMFYGFKTSQIATPYEGIKGEHILTRLQIKDNLAKRWSKAFSGVEAAEPKPVTLKTVLNKVDLSIVPQEYESSYIGIMRQKGQNPRDWPFEAYILGQIMNKLNEEFEYAIWQGEEAAVAASTDYLRETFDGYLTLIADAITATDLTPVVTGAINSTNAVDQFQAMWAALPEAYKETGADFFCSYAVYDAYRIHYKNKYSANPVETPIVNNANYTAMGLQYELGGGNSKIIPIAGMSGSGRVVLTPQQNLTYGMDDPADVGSFNVEQEDRQLKFWLDFRMGAQIMINSDDAMVVNDQT
jgi:hypothetical protein